MGIYLYKTIILPVVLYGCETWSLTLREEHRLRVFENRVFKRIFGPKKMCVYIEARGSLVVKALDYKPSGLSQVRDPMG
jgi:hypothetical protein